MCYNNTMLEFFAFVLWAAALDGADIAPLARAHAHNDFEHTRPLHDALDHGFTSVEADVFLRDGKLLVGHTVFQLKPERTLESLYLRPLRQRVKDNGGSMYRDGPRFYLLIDIKSEARTTYAAVHTVLAEYADIVSAVRSGKRDEKAVTAVVSGNRPIEEMRGQEVRYAGYDGRLADLDSNHSATLMPWISDRFGAHFTWRGDGPMPEGERVKLKDFAARAHAKGRQLRFWGTPENSAVWRELRAAGVDRIGADRLADLRDFLLASKPNGP
jgi:hypothetical protein